MLSRSVRVEDVFEDCLLDIQSGKRSIEECLASYPGLRSELEPTLRLAVLLRSTGNVQASPEFQGSAVTRLQNRISSQPRKSRPISKGWAVFHNFNWLAKERLQFSRFFQKAILIAVSVLLLFVLLGSGIVSASAHALPGQPFYPTKIAVEKLQLFLSPSAAADARLHLVFASRRLEESDILLNQNQSQDISGTLTDYVTHVSKALTALSVAERINTPQDVASVERAIQVLEEQEQRMTRLVDRFQIEKGSALEKALAKSQEERVLLQSILKRRIAPILNVDSTRTPRLPGYSSTRPAQISTQWITATIALSPQSTFSILKTSAPATPVPSLQLPGSLAQTPTSFEGDTESTDPPIMPTMWSKTPDWSIIWPTRIATPHPGARSTRPSPTDTPSPRNRRRR